MTEDRMKHKIARVAHTVDELFEKDFAQLKTKKKGHSIVDPNLDASYQGSKLLSLQEASYFLGISQSTLRKWTLDQKYKLPYVKFGTLIRYRFDDLQKFLNQQTHNKEGF